MKQVDLIVTGGWVIPAHDLPYITNGAVAVSDGKVLEVGKVKDLLGRYPQAQKVVGNNGYLIMPGLINSHSHGRGLSDFQRGALDNTLETWRLNSPGYVPVPTKEDVMFSAIRLLKSGVTATMHNHIVRGNAESINQQCQQAIEAYREVGIRSLFCLGIKNANPWVYGDNEKFMNNLSQKAQKTLNTSSESFEISDYFSIVRNLYNTYKKDQKTRIGFGPVAPQWCSEDLLLNVKEEADYLGVSIHLHTLQTVFQKIYSLQMYGKSYIEYLFDLGLLDNNLVLGHCVYPTTKDIKLMAENEVGVTHHPTCNLRQRNGISPIFHMLNNGVTVGLGIDGKSINDDDDFIQEMKVCRILHRLPSLELDSPCLTNHQIFKMSTDNGANLIGFKGEIGRLEPGYKADIVLLDVKNMTYPYTYDEHDPIDILLYRGGGRYVDTVLVQGEIVLEKGRPTKVDEVHITNKLAEFASQRPSKKVKDLRDALAEVRHETAHFFSGWTNKIDYDPYYIFNSKKDG